MNKMLIRNRRHNAIQIHFAPDFKISIIWGFGSYSDRHDWEPPKDSTNRLKDLFDTFLDSTTVEIMFLDIPKEFKPKIVKKYGKKNPIGYIEVADLIEMLNYCKNLTLKRNKVANNS